MRSRRPTALTLLTTALLVLLPTLAVLQYRWVGQVSEVLGFSGEWNRPVADHQSGMFFLIYEMLVHRFRTLGTLELSDHDIVRVVRESDRVTEDVIENAQIFQKPEEGAANVQAKAMQCGRIPSSAPLRTHSWSQ